jgi:isopenicillin-N N-acyltransferase-like protein
MNCSDNHNGDDAVALLDLSVIELQGTPRQLGEQLGEATRSQTRELFERRLAAAIRSTCEYSGRVVGAEQVLDVARSGLPISESYDPIGYEEFLGIARGSGISPEELYVTQGLTDLRDVLALSDSTDAEGCSSFIIGGSRSAGGNLLIGQSWDLLFDNLPYVRLVHRIPSDGSPSTWSLTLTGCLTLIGLNSEGIAVGNTNLRTGDVRPGVQYLSVLHRAIRSHTFEEAVCAVRNAPRSAAHYYYVADANGQSVGLECSATRCESLYTQNDLLVHCNHALTAPIAELEVTASESSTCCRQQRLSFLLESHKGGIGVQDIKAMLSDHAGGENALCRHGENASDVTTNACVIMSPQTREIHACRGPAHCGQWHTAKVRPQ